MSLLSVNASQFHGKNLSALQKYSGATTTESMIPLYVGHDPPDGKQTVDGDTSIECNVTLPLSSQTVTVVSLLQCTWTFLVS